MQATPENVTLLGKQLDHPESVFVDAAGVIYCGSEGGQIFRISLDGQQAQMGATNGSILGLVVDGKGRVHCCDCQHAAVFRVDPDGAVKRRSTGALGRQFMLPNHPVFDRAGRLYVSDSGEYWKATGAIFVVQPDDTTEIFHSGPFHFPNGIAIDPSEQWLYIAQSAAWNIIRISLDNRNRKPEIMFQLPKYTIADGMWFARDGRLFVGCYRPDQVVCCHPGGEIEVVVEDRTAELIAAPTNVFPHAQRLYIGNFGGQHLTMVAMDVERGLVHMPLNLGA